MLMDGTAWLEICVVVTAVVPSLVNVPQDVNTRKSINANKPLAFIIELLHKDKHHFKPPNDWREWQVVGTRVALEMGKTQSEVNAQKRSGDSPARIVRWLFALRLTN